MVARAAVGAGLRAGMVLLKKLDQFIPGNRSDTLKLSYAPLVNLPGFQSGGLTPFSSLKPRKVHERSIFDACF
jgi:hypothetical protein